MQNNIAACRKKAGLTQTQLAEMLGFTSSGTVSQWESGDRAPHASVLPKLAEALGCSIDELLVSEPFDTNH